VGETLRVEATGESVSEAKWSALRQLQRLAPALDTSTVSFQVISEGQRGLLGVGYEPAHVAAVVVAERGTPPASAPQHEPLEPATRLRSLLEQVTTALDIDCRIEVSFEDGILTGTCLGSADELGLLIGRHGQTLDALQLLAAAMLRGDRDERLEVVVDAAGYRARRRRRLEEIAEESAEQARRTGARVSLEPMSAAERKIIHTSLEAVSGIATSSEGVEPDRYVVVDPA
jgi:spoIIIJ-associated protein